MTLPWSPSWSPLGFHVFPRRISCPMHARPSLWALIQKLVFPQLLNRKHVDSCALAFRPMIAHSSGARTSAIIGPCTTPCLTLSVAPVRMGRVSNVWYTRSTILLVFVLLKSTQTVIFGHILSSPPMLMVFAFDLMTLVAMASTATRRNQSNTFGYGP